ARIDDRPARVPVDYPLEDIVNALIAEPERVKEILQKARQTGAQIALLFAGEEMQAKQLAQNLEREMQSAFASNWTSSLLLRTKLQVSVKFPDPLVMFSSVAISILLSST
ncbi:MAG: hypothetical protein AAF870_06745, partial [Pseudomonadota bacterium]